MAHATNVGKSKKKLRKVKKYIEYLKGEFLIMS